MIRETTTVRSRLPILPDVVLGAVLLIAVAGTYCIAHVWWCPGAGKEFSDQSNIKAPEVFITRHRHILELKLHS